MSKENDKNRANSYGTFQGVPTYPPLSHPRPPSHHPVSGFPKPTPPHGAAAHHDISVHQYIREHQTVPGYPVAEVRPVKEDPIPCCGLGIGWFLFITGFLLGAVPWYIAVFIQVRAKINPREKPGYVACTIAAIVATLAIVYGFMGGRGAWS